MKQLLIYILTGSLLLSCNKSTNNENSTEEVMRDTTTFKKGYADVNGLHMYYEVYGSGKPLVLVHGGGSTIQTSFGSVIPLLGAGRQLIAVELQAHGRTSDRDAALSFEQDADDVAALLRQLGIDSADFLGFSNGGTTCMQIAIRHPKIVDKLILASALCKRDGVPAAFWDFMEHGTLEQMPQAYKDAYRQVAPHPEHLHIMFERCAQRMIHFSDLSDSQIASISCPTLIVIGDKDVMTPEHAVEMHRKIPNSRLAIVPGGHGAYLGEVTTLRADTKPSDFIVPMILRFLDGEMKD
ncbi:MAG TPA: alpha/beta hydrolase [Cytophagales bacterium]|nr:alpha/beta hydrolase [Cytophagales bacterium]